MDLPDVFPNLAEEGYEETSPATRRYNCVAWAAGRTDQVWWPDPQAVGYWPEDASRSESLEAFFRAFESIGYMRCDDGNLEATFEKIAFFALSGQPKHAARQLEDGRWSSKLGKSIDITHALGGLEGPVYGQVVAFMKRLRTSQNHDV
jgi:hypothetical protein